MRLCLIVDLLHGARALSGAAPDCRRLLADTLIYQAHAAHSFAKRFGKPHPRWGNGSLMARALAESDLQASPKPGFEAIAVMAEAIARFRARNFSPETLVCSAHRPYVTLTKSKGGSHGRNQNQTHGG